jgi:hypothetical protein
VAALRVLKASAMQANLSFQTRFLRQPMAPMLPVGKRCPRHVAVSWAVLRQASACQYLRNCVTEIKAQGCVEDLVCGGTRVVVSMGTALVEAAIPFRRATARRWRAVVGLAWPAKREWALRWPNCDLMLILGQ